MKKVTFSDSRHAARPRRLSVSEAKARLSDAVRRAGEEAIIIHNRGRDVAALVGIDEYEKLQQGTRGARRFLDAVADLKRRFGGGAEIEVERAAIHPVDPFSERRVQRRS